MRELPIGKRKSRYTLHPLAVSRWPIFSPLIPLIICLRIFLVLFLPP